MFSLRHILARRANGVTKVAPAVMDTITVMLGAALSQPLAKDLDPQLDDALVYLAPLCRTAGIEPVRA